MKDNERVFANLASQLSIPIVMNKKVVGLF